jgi:hypothetical protein
MTLYNKENTTYCSLQLLCVQDAQYFCFSHHSDKRVLKSKSSFLFFNAASKD